MFGAFGAGAVINLPNLTSATLQDFYKIAFEAADGGEVKAPQLNSLTGGIGVYAEDPGSWVDISGFANTIRNAGSGTSRIEIRNGARVSVGNVATLDRVNLTILGAGDFPTTQLRQFHQGTLYLANNTANGEVNVIQAGHIRNQNSATGPSFDISLGRARIGKDASKPGQIYSCPDPIRHDIESASNRAQDRQINASTRRGEERTGVGQQGQQSNLPDECAFARHVRSGD